MKGLLTILLLCGLQLNAWAKGIDENPSKKDSQSKTIVLITGAFVSNRGWDEWKAYYERKGYRVLAPAWPHKEGPADELRRRHPDRELAALELETVVNYHAELISKLPEKPILIGHSFGGLIVQKLLQRDLGYAGVAYHSVPPKGVITLKHSFIKSLWKPLGIFKSKKKPYLMSFKHWQYTFTNGMQLDEQKAYYDKLVVPESRVLMRAALKKPGKVDFKKELAPLLFIGGTEDHIMPASLDKKIYNRYKKHAKKQAIIDYHEFPATNHLAMAQPNWRSEADFILEWITSQTTPQTVTKN